MVELQNQRLYLAKSEKEEIFVDTPGLLQHQYEGIRFLYRQYKKGKQGAILNDPPGYGMRVQTVSFINAMRSTIKLPTLILVSDYKEELWLRRFSVWTDMESDVAIQGLQEIVNPRCVVSNICFTSALARREWGLVVVDDDSLSRDVVRSSINCKFKIWITNNDLQKNLHTFSGIYKWMFPKGRFAVENFKQSKKSPMAAFGKAAQLDAFLEDIVIRRKVIATPHGAREKILSPVKVTKKNKDSTGKKIKRSKPNRVEAAEVIESQAFGNIAKNATIQESKVKVDDDVQMDEIKDTDLSDDKSIVKNETVDFKINVNDDVEMAAGKDKEIISNVSPKCEEIEDKSITKNATVNANSNVLITEGREDKISRHDTNSEIEGSSIKIDDISDVHMAEAKNEISSNATVRSNEIGDKSIAKDENVQECTANETKENDNKVSSYVANTNNDIIGESINKKENSGVMETGNSDAVSTSDAVNKYNVDETYKLLNSDNVNSQNIVIRYDSETPDLSDEITKKNVSGKLILSEDLFSAETSDIKCESKDIADTELVNPKDEINVTITEAKTDTNGFESKMKQMEELAMKKFKGSLLDNIF